MFYSDENHQKRLREAFALTGAVKADGHVDSDFCASLYLLAGMPSVYSRAKRFLSRGCIDFPEMLDGLGFSAGETILVSLAGNLFNGGFFDRYTPVDIIGYCDCDTVQLVCSALMLRKSRLKISDFSSISA